MKDENIKEILETINDLIKIASDKGSYAMSYKMWKQLLDYITNLQEIADVYNRKYREVKMLKEQLLYEKENTKVYKSRNEKAIEYLEEQDMSYYGAVVNTKMEIILNILGGKDE